MNSKLIHSYPFIDDEIKLDCPISQTRQIEIAKLNNMLQQTTNLEDREDLEYCIRLFQLGATWRNLSEEEIALLEYDDFPNSRSIKETNSKSM